MEGIPRGIRKPFHHLSSGQAPLRLGSAGLALSRGGNAKPGTAGLSGPSKNTFLRALEALAALTDFVAQQVYQSRAKDWSNSFRKATFRSEEEMFAVLGRPEENSFVKSTREDMKTLKAAIRSLSEAL